MNGIRCVILIITVLQCIIAEAWEEVNIICPNECVCQNSHFMDLSIARWINRKENKQQNDEKEDTYELSTNNEAMFANDESFLTNPLVKFAMCFLQSGHQPKDLINVLPQDVQALVLMYSGKGENITAVSSDFKVLTDLTTLEIRGSADRNFQLIIDEPLGFIQNANFELIRLTGSESLKRPINSIHPSESFDYVPDSEKVSYNVSLELENDDEIEILPYDVYVMEMKKSQMASFYGWESLAVLRIHNCKLDELHWEMFNGLGQLEHLSLEHNDIKIVPAFAFYGALHIKSLSLAHNVILDLNYRSLAGLLELENLDLSYNNISKLSELTFPPFPKLNYIDFRNNPIRFVFPDVFGVMNKTKIMHIGSDSAKLELSTTHPFDSLNELKYLTIYNVKAEVLNQNVFKGLRNLEILKLRGEISKIEFDTFIEMPKLRELDLSNCSLNEVSMDAFIGCRNLEIVNLSNNNISYIPPGLFDDQKHLSEIYLQKNRLRYLPFNFFANSALKLARLTENPWKCSCDMATWDPKITNQIRGYRQERCIREFHSGKVISCRMIDNYKFDNKLAPRCYNVKNRTIYYALRKELKCDFKKEYHRATKNLLNMAKSKHLEVRRNKSKIQNAKKIEKVVPISRSERQQRILDKIKNTLREKNSLKYLSTKNSANSSNSRSNGVLGNADSYESFNYI